MRAANHYTQTAPVNSLGEVKVGEEKAVVPFLIHIKFLRGFFIIIIMFINTKKKHIIINHCSPPAIPHQYLSGIFVKLSMLNAL